MSEVNERVIPDKCLICGEPTPETRLPASYHAVIVELLKVFWQYGNLGQVPPSIISRRKDGYCFCKECKITLMDVHKTHVEIEQTQKEINDVVAQAASKIILSCQSEGASGQRSSGDELMKTETVDEMDSDEVSGNQEPTDYEMDKQANEFRKLVMQRFSPSVRILPKDRLICEAGSAVSGDLGGNHGDGTNDGEDQMVLYKHSYGVSMVSLGAVSILRDHNHGSSSIIKVGNQVKNAESSSEDNQREWKCGCCERLFKNSEELFHHLEILRLKRLEFGENASCDVIEVGKDDENDDTNDIIAEDIAENAEKGSETFANPNSKYKCKECGHEFKSSWHLKRHEKVHLKETVVMDSRLKAVNKQTTTNLKETGGHEQTPTEEKDKPYACTFKWCTKRFSDNWKLKRHEAVHSKEQSFECNSKAQEKTTALHLDIRDHEETHMESGPCTCSSKGCLKKFASQPDMKAHLRSSRNKKQKTRSSPVEDTDEDIIVLD